MLKFLEKSPTNKSQRTPIRYHPQKTYGNSFESPSQFQNKFGIINEQSYFNPFLKYDRKQGLQQSGRQCRSVQPRWTHKINISNLQNSKIQEMYSNESRQKVTQSERYHQEISLDPNRFKMVKGQFTEYLNKNHHYRSIGPLQGIQRSDHRIEITKTSLKQKQESRIEELTTSNKFKSQLYNTIKSNLIKNSSLLSQRNRIKRNRDIIHRNFRRQLQKRKKNTSYSFNLPHLESKQDALMIEHLTTNTSGYNRRYKTEFSQI